ncbi:MAG TPA: DUF4124 domain-containing protein [Candidatus Competibacteraceae bacterium]|nr:DUF4124 domain-containing protein [Candidatus Competibacteraceae bacterium]
MLAINKCVDDVGKVVYQSAPCPATAKGSEITLQKAPPVPVASPVDAEELKRIQQTANAMERERKLKEINRVISDTEELITDYRQAMNSELSALQQKKQLAQNNLAGATWEQSISAEMSSVTQKYDALIRDQQTRIERLRADADQLRKTP